LELRKKKTTRPPGRNPQKRTKTTPISFEESTHHSKENRPQPQLEERGDELLLSLNNSRK